MDHYSGVYTFKRPLTGCHISGQAVEELYWLASQMKPQAGARSHLVQEPEKNYTF